MVQSHGYAALSAKEKLVPFAFERRDPGPHDVTLDILYCGICHSDLCFVNDDWKMSVYPMVPGHEIVGRIVAVGNQVSKFALGDMAAIGCIVDSCRTCAPCTQHLLPSAHRKWSCRATRNKWLRIRDNSILFWIRFPRRTT